MGSAYPSIRFLGAYSPGASVHAGLTCLQALAGESTVLTVKQLCRIARKEKGVPIFHVIIQRSQRGEERLAYRPPSIEFEDPADLFDLVASERLARERLATTGNSPASIVAESTQRRDSQNTSRKGKRRNSLHQLHRKRTCVSDVENDEYYAFLLVPCPKYMYLESSSR